MLSNNCRKSTIGGENKMMIGYVFIVIFGAACVLMGLFMIIYYVEKAGNQQISFRSFKALYAVAPTKWSINYDLHPRYRRGKYEYEDIYMSTYCGYLRYLHFKKSASRREKRKALNEDMEDLISHWHGDIEAYRENAAREVRSLADKVKVDVVI